VVNAGGLITVAQEFRGGSREAARDAADRIGDRLLGMIEDADDRGTTVFDAAERYAEDRIRSTSPEPLPPRADRRGRANMFAPGLFRPRHGRTVVRRETASSGTKEHGAGGDRAATCRRVRRRWEAVRREELATALTKLEARGELTDEGAAVVARMTANIVDGLLPAGSAEAVGDREAAAELFDPER